MAAYEPHMATYGFGAFPDACTYCSGLVVPVYLSQGEHQGSDFYRLRHPWTAAIMAIAIGLQVEHLSATY